MTDTAAVPSPSRAAPRSLASVVWVTSLGFSIVQLDGSVLNVALVEIGRSLRSPLGELQWVVNTYTLVYACLLLSAGAVTDRIGARRAFVWGFAVFAGASAACAAAPSAGVLIAARAIQGVGGALLVPSSLALLNHACRDDPAARARAVGLWAAAGGVAVAAGPVLSGLLVGAVGWRGVFLVNAPLGLLGIWLAMRSVEEATMPAPRAPRRLDWAGQLLAALSLGALVGSIVGAGPGGWHPGAAAAGLALAAAAAAAFVCVELRVRDPVLPAAVLRSRLAATAMAVGFVVSFNIFGLVFALALHFQDVLRYSPLQTGLAFVPFSLAIIAGNVAGSRIAAAAGPRPVLLAGLLVAAAGMAALAGLGAETSYLAMLPEHLVVRIGIGLAVPTMTTILLASVPREDSGVASGAFTAARQAGAAVGVAVYGALMAADPVVGLNVALAISAATLLGAAAVAATAFGRDQGAAAGAP